MVRAGQLGALPAQDLQCRRADRCETQPQSLLRMIKHPHAQAPELTLTAYKDNAAVIEGHPGRRFRPDPATQAYRAEPIEPSAFAIKVETHNHPTAISPFAGASTGAGGEIRDEGATGRGGRPKAGLSGFSVSHLRIPPSAAVGNHGAMIAHGVALESCRRSIGARRSK